MLTAENEGNEWSVFPCGTHTARDDSFIVKMRSEVTLQRSISYTLLPVCGHLEQSRQLRSSGESGNLPLNGSALLLQLCALIGAAELLRQTKARTVHR